jgi:hypothetical protein
MKKIYVDVKSVLDKEGNWNPILLFLDNGHVFDINKITDITRRTNMALARFTCIIGNRPAYLFFEDPRWFIIRP